MNGKMLRPSVLLIDDNQGFLECLETEVERVLGGEDVDVRVWRPSADDEDPFEVLERLIDSQTVLVATDFDLSGGGMKGLFGPTVVGWCKSRFIPVGDFSRANVTTLPSRPDLFELRIPLDERRAATFIGSAFRGFKEIRRRLVEGSTIVQSKTSPADVLAWLVGRPHLYSHMALYMARVGSDSGALMDRLLPSDGSDKQSEDKIQILTYVLGHVLVNMILRFPGPILSDLALCAYVATSLDESDRMDEIFRDARFGGPFGDSRSYYWREEVDAILDSIGEELADVQFEAFGQFNRAVAEHATKGQLRTHDCVRCGGKEGGFLCPFTERAVCQRSDCSVPASSWIPQGADLCRIEKDFFDEWAPVLGF